MNISDFFYTAQEAADFLGINRITIWRWIKADKFEVQKVGGVVLIPKWQIALVKKQTSVTTGS